MTYPQIQPAALSIRLITGYRYAMYLKRIKHFIKTPGNRSDNGEPELSEKPGCSMKQRA